MTYGFTAEVWEHDGPAAWHFVTLPPDVADEIDEVVGPDRRGFGSVRVEVTVGATTWRTSMFPDTKAGSYVLPMKKEVRRAEDLHDGSRAEVTIELVDE
jgi:hypothetical protein